MQTFLPYAEFPRCAQALDFRRLDKQRVEAYQILRVLGGQSRGWRNHPAVVMWRGYEGALGLYLNAMIAEWKWRGYTNAMALYQMAADESPRMPPWLGDPELHASHRANLLRKDRTFYGRYGWTESSDMPFRWPIGKNGRARMDAQGWTR